MVDIGLSIGNSHHEPIDRTVELVADADEFGFECSWILDSQLTMKDTYVVQSQIAEHTEDIELGPGVTNFVTRDMSVTANAITDVWEVSDGRARLGLGTGDSAVSPIGEEPSSLREFRKRIEDTRKLLQGEEITYNGEDVQFKSVQGYPPIYVAASGPTSLRLAGEFGDGVIVMTPADPDMVRQALEHVQNGIDRRDPDLLSEPALDLWVTISVDDDVEQAAQDVKPQAVAQARWLHERETLPETLDRHRAEMEDAAEAYEFSDHLSLDAEHADLVSDEFARAVAVAGGTDHCIDRLQELADVGVDQITLSLLSKGREQRLQHIGENVLPALS